jgi:flagellar FliL protein
MPISPTEESPRGAKEAEGGSPPPVAGGFKPWLPLLVVVAVMPVLAFVTTKFVLLPRMERVFARENPGTNSESNAVAGAAEGKESGKAATPGKMRMTVPLSKLLVNVAGTMGTRYLMTSVTLVGNTPDFKTKIEENRDQLMDLANGALGTKTISDLEKPGARNVIRSELMTVFNDALGGPVVQEIYITELAIQ